MEKPIVFLSHSSRNKRELLALKQLLDEKAAGFIDFFLSSDGESIPLGTNWVIALNEALKGTKLMFVFVTKEALQSEWILFEAGHAYGRGPDVVPVCLPGTELKHLPAPLKLLQAQTLHTAGDLGALAKKCNQVFGTKIPQKFTAAEFTAVFEKTTAVADMAPFEARVIDPWPIIVSEISASVVGPAGGLKLLTKLCTQAKLNSHAKKPLGADWEDLNTSGMTMIERSKWFDNMVPGKTSEKDHRLYEITLSPGLFHITAPIVDAWANRMGSDIAFALRIKLSFQFEVRAEHRPHEVSTKIFGSGIEVTGDNFFKFHGMYFSLYRGGNYGEWEPEIRFQAFQSEWTKRLPELVSILLDRKIFLLGRDLEKQLKKR